MDVIIDLGLEECMGIFPTGRAMTCPCSGGWKSRGREPALSGQGLLPVVDFCCFLT